MSWSNIKRDKADILFSNYIRQKAGWKCVKCGKLCKIDGSWVAKLEASHYWSRSHEGTRFDEDNVWSLCGSCHKRMGGRRKEENGEYDLWLKEKLGQERYNQLMVRANTYKKKDRVMSLLIAQELVKDLK